MFRLILVMLPWSAINLGTAVRGLTIRELEP